jgi:uncharacterized membrane protein YcaP (DUF421 family)
MGNFLEHAIQSPPLVIAFRGQALTKVMKIHRISTTDLNSALRKEKIWNIKEVECVIIGKSAKTQDEWRTTSLSHRARAVELN